MRVNLRKLLKICILVAASLPTVTSAGWYAKMKNQKISECIFWNESVDESWNKLNKKFGSCVLQTGPGAMISGLTFHCASNNTQLLFRMREDCELYQKTGSVKIRSEEYAPKGIENPTAWVEFLDECLTKAATKAVANKLLVLHKFGFLEAECMGLAAGMGEYTIQERKLNESRYLNKIEEISKEYSMSNNASSRDAK